MESTKSINITEIDECEIDTPVKSPVECVAAVGENGQPTKASKAKKLLSSLSNFSVPQIFRRQKRLDHSADRNYSFDSNHLEFNRPLSMCLDNYVPSMYQGHYQTENQYSDVLFDLRESKIMLFESERHRANLEMKVETLETEINHLRMENDDYKEKVRTLTSVIRELERQKDNRLVDEKERCLNTRIREMELTSEMASLSQRLGDLEAKSETIKVEKIVADQGRLAEQNLPFLNRSMETVMDHEDGLFSNKTYEECIKHSSSSINTLQAQEASPFENNHYDETKLAIDVSEYNYEHKSSPNGSCDDQVEST